MATESRYLHSEEDVTRQANMIKELVIQRLSIDGLLTDEDATRFLETHTVVVAKKGVFGSFIDKALGLSSADERKYQIVEMRKAP